MREIKFRCWNAFANTMVPWDRLVSLNKIHLLNEQRGDYQIMQFTGLKDKSGVDIYEGDIVKMYHQDPYGYSHIESTVSKFKFTGANTATCIGKMPDVRVITWRKGALMLDCRDGGHGHTRSFNELANPGESFEVIGNIYQNKDLLK